MADQSKKPSSRELTGVLFYDAPGAPTMKGNVQKGKKIEITAEPGVDKKQTQYTRLIGDKVSGALYPNERKTSDNHPDFTGPISVNGEEMRVAAWKREMKKGSEPGAEYLSLALSAKMSRD